MVGGRINKEKPMKKKVIFWFAMSVFWGVVCGLFIGYQFGTSEPQTSTFVGIIVSFILAVIAILRSEFLLNADKIIIPEEKQKEPSKKLSPHNRAKFREGEK
jgi:purine-cytosine permease-like protein